MKMKWVVSFNYEPVPGWENSDFFWRRWHSPLFWKPTKTMYAFKLFNFRVFIYKEPLFNSVNGVETPRFEIGRGVKQIFKFKKCHPTTP